MKIWAAWHGGSSYSVFGIPEDVETFPSIQAACDAFGDRYYRGYTWRQAFEYVNREPASVLTPCVEQETTEMWLYFYDPSDERDPYPDRIVKFGQRGGIRVEPA